MTGPVGAAGGTGPQGPAGPNELSASTKTALNGLLKGTGSAVATAVANTDYLPAESPVVKERLTITGEYGELELTPGDMDTYPVIASGGGLLLSSPSILAIDPTNGGPYGVAIGDNQVALGDIGPQKGGVHVISYGAITEDNDVANKKYVDDKAPSKPTALTLKSSGWSSSAQTLTVNGVVADETAQIVNVAPATANFKAYMDAGIYVSAVAAGRLTFTCATAPGADLTVYVSIQNVG